MARTVGGVAIVGPTLDETMGTAALFSAIYAVIVSRESHTGVVTSERRAALKSVSAD